eukprot:CAMPEP_0176495442 /NCGR_PEP_ID=MMETSP0200_2-20121128/10653_1 /TAXON_ID=947934 /ORGANISM="Chaetoceros sp., Strain GSL56" /LENGTH=797 /DNA_ID=CAMNT_0017893309 /DNA_START=72 /DNA_END=2465 /DNA_ORIENTATION=-
MRIRNLRHRPKKYASPAAAVLGLPEVTTLFRNEQPDMNRLSNKKYVIRSWLKYIVGVFIVLTATSLLIIPVLFGQHPVHGGYIGMFVDSRIRLHLWNKKVKDVEKEAYDLGLDVPLKSIQSRTRNVPYATTLEIIHRYREEHKFLMTSTLQHGDQYGSSNKNGASSTSNKAIIPWIIVRQKHPWNRPLRFKNSSSWVVLDFDLEDIDTWIDTYMIGYEYIKQQTFQILKGQDRIEMFFIVFLCHYGGIYLNNESNIHQREFQEFRNAHGQDISERQHGWISTHNENIDSLIVTANNTFLTCMTALVQDISMKNNASISIFQAILNVYHHSISEMNGNTNGDFLMLPSNCKSVFPLNSSMSSYNKKQQDTVLCNLPVKEISVNITAVNEPIPTYTTKLTIDQILMTESWFCHGLWMWPCHRCLKSAMQGSYKKCAWACSPCLNFMYNHPTQNPKDDQGVGNDDDDNIVHVHIHIHGYLLDSSSSKYKLIPRIIHQTWFEHITPMNYPSLYRLQNQWKMSGWEYRFYTDETARKYIVDNFPLHFLEAYDTLIHGAYKADLFRYMLLLKEGGVYADVDVMLETSLEQFVSPNMSFFTPRDCVAEFADGQYCLWNGIIGVAPGHPIMVHAVERLVNSILNRSDLLDLEREVAKKSGVNTETWKVRAVQELLLSGPCALGIATNEVLGRNPLVRFEVDGLNDQNLNENLDREHFGDMMILMQDKQDMGAMRFTDIERGIIFASTDMDGLSKQRIRSPSDHTYVKSKPHYSSSGKGFWLWGSRDVYRDNMVSTKKVKIHAQYT